MLFSRQLNQFFATVKYGSYIKAANEISITPSALSHGIKELENSIGKKLINRHKSGITLTAEGRFLYNEMYEVFNHGSKVFMQLKGNNSVKNKVTRLKTDGISLPQLTHNLNSILSKSFGKISFINGEPNDLLNSLKRGECDIAVESCVEISSNTHPSILKMTSTPEKIGLLINEEVYKSYKFVSDILKEKVLIQSGAMLAHPICTHFQLNLNKNKIAHSFIGLPELSDTYSAVANGLGVSVVTINEFNDKVIQKKNLRFIEKPFPFYPYVYRNIYLHRDRYDELENIAIYLHGGGS